MSEFIIPLEDHLCVDLKTREWCKLPYPGHPKGCPNYNKKNICPPIVGIVDDIFDLSKPHWFAIVKFDLKAHVDRMLLKHPNWSEKQCRCVLYWQQTVNKNLREYSEKFVSEMPGTIYTTCPEAMGVHVFYTFKKLGLEIKRNPDIVNKVALIGFDAKKPKQTELEFS